MKTLTKFDLTLLEEEQKNLALKVDYLFEPKLIKTVAGIDVSYANDNKSACAAISVLNTDGLELIETAIHIDCVDFPYIPQFLAHRELPIVRKAFSKLKIIPDLIVYDGNGRLHKRKFGAASAFGLETGIPTIGCTKSPPVSQAKFGGVRGSSEEIYNNDDHIDVIGLKLITQANLKPVYVSVGHKINLKRCAEFILAYCPKYRIPEPIRQADRISREVMRTKLI